jgi:beta-xylosidase
VLSPGKTALKGPHQGGWVETPSGQGWFIHFNSAGAYGRIVHLQPVTWKNDWPFIGETIPGAGPEATAGQPVAEHAMPDVGGRFTPVWPQTSDTFASAKLGVQWEWNHNPDDSRWSLTQRPGFLRLTAGPAINLVSARNTLTQSLQSKDTVITTRVDVRGLVEGQRAGLAMFGAGISAIGVVKRGGASRIVFSSRGVDTLGPVMPAGSADLRVAVADQAARYSYSLDGGKSFVEVGGTMLPRFSWWKGARPALFTYGDPAQSGQGVADFDWVMVKRMAP